MISVLVVNLGDVESARTDPNSTSSSAGTASGAVLYSTMMQYAGWKALLAIVDHQVKLRGHVLLLNRGYDVNVF